mmetsp:Transcript_9224/g.20983  ORF Transcript_9224/g.20983 Transcript_9224/m.20983 type:complete len:83 (-) Transcript_9224:160-408(-)
MSDLKAQAAIRKVEDRIIGANRSLEADPHRRGVLTNLAGLEQASQKFRVKVGLIKAQNARLRGEMPDIPQDVRAQVYELMAR